MCTESKTFYLFVTGLTEKNGAWEWSEESRVQRRCVIMANGNRHFGRGSGVGTLHA